MLEVWTDSEVDIPPRRGEKNYSDYNDTKKRLEYKYVLLTCQQLYVCFLYTLTPCSTDWACGNLKRTLDASLYN